MHGEKKTNKRKKKFLIFLGFIFVIITGTLFLLFSKEEEERYAVRYYETFRYVQNSEEQQILFINQLSQKETPERWHIRVYFDTKEKWVFLESFNQKGKKMRRIKNTLFIQSTEL